MIRGIFRFFSLTKLTSKSISLNSIKSSQLTTPMMNKNVCFWLSPKLCATIFQSSSGNFSDFEVERFKDFLASSKNIRQFDTNNVNKCDLELAKFIRSSNSNQKLLSSESKQHVTDIMKHLDSCWVKPKMIKIIIIPKLEEVYAENRAISNRIRFVTWFKNLFYYLLYQLKKLYRYDLKAKMLRKTPRNVKTIEGMHRAHKVSLKLAVELWMIIEGKTVNTHEKNLLKHILSEKVNIYHTCEYTNKVLHVKYDNEIINALKQQNQNGGNIPIRLTSGSKMRLNQILNALNKLKARSPELREFCIKSDKLLRTIY